MDRRVHEVKIVGKAQEITVCSKFTKFANSFLFEGANARRCHGNSKEKIALVPQHNREIPSEDISIHFQKVFCSHFMFSC